MSESPENDSQACFDWILMGSSKPGLGLSHNKRLTFSSAAFAIHEPGDLDLLQPACCTSSRNVEIILRSSCLLNSKDKRLGNNQLINYILRAKQYCSKLDLQFLSNMPNTELDDLKSDIRLGPRTSRSLAPWSRIKTYRKALFHRCTQK